MMNKQRPEFMTPRPISNTLKKLKPDVPSAMEIPSILEKRKFNIAFSEDKYEEERYNQYIPPDYFKQKIGHSVEAPEPDFQATVDSVIKDFRIEFTIFQQTNLSPEIAELISLVPTHRRKLASHPNRF
jgi:hypothetical protein